MKLKRIMAIVLCFAMVLSTMSFNVFANESTVGTEEDLKAALAAGGTIVLSNDITVAEQLVIPEGVEVTIDLNGKTITGELNGDSTTNHIYVMANYGTLTITDSGEDGAIISRGVYNYGKLTLENGKIDACDCNGGYAVNNESGSVFIMNGGSVTANYEDGDAPESGNYDATALDVPENCTATLNGGTISNAGNFTFAISVEGELIVPEDSTVSVTGVHGTVAVMGGEANIAGGTFKLVGSPNVTDSLIYVPSGTANITGGSFDASETLSSSGRIIGAYDSGKVTVNGGTFTSNGWFDFADSSIENVTVNAAICVDCDDTVKSYVAENATITLNGESYTAPDDGGSDGEEDTILINTVEELIELRDNVNEGTDYYEGKNVKLNADINLENINWTPIGSASVDHGFMGNFDGNGHTIFNLTIEDPALDGDGYAYAGFFGVTEGTENNQNTIKNLTIENVTITTDGHIASAAIAYPYYTIVENVNICGDIAIEGGDYTAGVLAYTRRCVNAKDLTITGNDGSYIKGAQVVGGVISDIQMNGGLIADYSNFNAEGLTVKGELNVGGISGIIASQTLDTCSVKNVTLDCDDARVGTVAGCLGGVSTISDATVENVSGASALIGGTYDDGKSVEAKIGDTYYATLATAISVAESGDTITLLCNVNAVEIPDGVTLNTNGYKWIQAKGTWGGIDWTLDTEGTLTIAPTKGEPVADKNAPTKRTYEVGEWRETVVYKSNGSASAIGGAPYDMKAVKKLIIEEGVTKIGSFSGQFPNLTGEVVIPSTVTYIGQEAFHKAPITSLVFAEGGTGKLCIANGAFKKTLIEEVILPKDRSEIHVHHWAFGGSGKLEKAYIPANVTKAWGGEHVDYFDNFNAQTNVTWAEYGSIFTGCSAMKTIEFENEEVRDLFFANGRQSTAEDYISVTVGLTAYSNFDDAFAAAKDSDTITLRKSVKLDKTYKVDAGKTITLDLNGKTITGTDNTEKNFSLIDNRGELTVTGNGKMTLTSTVNSGWNRYSAVLANNPGGKLIIENGTIEHLGGTDMAYGIDNLTNGKGTYAETIVNGGTIKSTYRGIRQFLNGVEADNILTINGGTVEGANKAIFFHDPSTKANTGKLTVADTATLTGGVYLFVTEGSTEWPVEVSIAASAVDVVTSKNVPFGYEVINENGYYGVKNATSSGYKVTAVASATEVRYNNGNPDSFTVEYIVTGGNVIGAMAQYNYDNTLFTCADDKDNDGKLILYNNDLTTDANGETVIAKLTFTVKKDVEVDTTYKFLAEKVQVTSDFGAAGSGTQDGFVKNVIGDEVTVVAQWKVTLPTDDSLAGNTYVDKNTDYSATINNFDENMTYTIKYIMGDSEKQTIEVTKDNAVNKGFVIKNVTGDIVFTDVSYELNCEIVLVPDYVTGCTLVIVKDGVANGYTYDNAPMYPVARYVGIKELPENANQYIVGDILNATSVRAILIRDAVDEDQARTAIMATDSEPDDIEESFDVNGNKDLYFSDAMVAHGCYKEQYDLALELAYYLRADVDTDLKIRTLDYDATVGAILDELYGN